MKGNVVAPCDDGLRKGGTCVKPFDRFEIDLHLKAEAAR